MAVFAIASAKGSPGVTTTCLALAWVWPQAYPGRQVLVVDADPAGSGIAFGYLRGEVPGAGAIGLAGVQHISGTDLWQQLIAMDDDRWLLLGPTDPAQVGALQGTWQQLADRLAEPLTWDGASPVDVLIDVGRLEAGAGHPLLKPADVVLLAMRSSLAGVASVRPVLNRSGRQEFRLLLVGEGRPYRSAEIARVLGREVAGPIAEDDRAAATLSDGQAAGASFKRSALLRSARQLADSLRPLVLASEGDHA